MLASGQKWRDKIAAGGAESEAIFEKIVARHARMPEEPFDVFALCEEIDALDLVVLEKMAEGRSGKIMKQHASERYMIVLNGGESRRRQRFVAAHELAHFLLHRHVLDENNGISDNVLLFSGSVPYADEMEANAFANWVLLPPEVAVKYLAANGDKNLYDMARAFEVSVSVVAGRLGIPVD